MENLDSIPSQETEEYIKNNHEHVIAKPHRNVGLIKSEQEFKHETEKAPAYRTKISHEIMETGFMNEFNDSSQYEIDASTENKPMDTVHEQLKVMENMDTTDENDDRDDMSYKDGIINKQKKKGKCDICETEFTGKFHVKHLKRHMKNVHVKVMQRKVKIKTHQCNSCEKAFGRPEHLRRHIQCVHEGQKNYKCDFCEKAFARPDRLKRHIAVKHEGFNEDARCKLCGKSYSEKSTLKRHILAVHKDEVYPDNEVYDESYGNDESDSYYQNEKSKFSCNICAKEFSRPQHVKRHIEQVHGKDINDEKYNPWVVNSLEEFLYYCCPECDLTRETIYQSKEVFFQHAMQHHPMAKETLEIFGMKEEPFDQNGTIFYDEYEGLDDSHLYYPTIEYEDENVDKSKETDDDPKIKLQCQYCNYSNIGNKRNLKRHIEAVHGTKKFNCEYCDMKFSRKDVLKGHVASIHKDKIQSVEKSINLQQNFINKSQSLEMKKEPLDENGHENTYIAQPDLFQTDIKSEIKADDDSYFNDISYDNGMKSESKKKAKCEICEKEFLGKNHTKHLRRHMKNVHDKQRNYEYCEYCAKNFETPEELKSHIKELHGENKEIKCHKCEKTFSRTDSLKQHIKEHNKIYPCEHCGKTFAYTKGLKVHIDTIHNRLTESMCDRCDKIFTRPEHLKRHIAFVHEGKKDIRNEICNKCGKTFADRSVLKKHIDTVHEGVRTEACKFCGKTFTHNSHLKSHIRAAHEGVKYPCDKCDKTFTTRSNLKVHDDSIHKGLKYQCPMSKCEKWFSQKQKIKSHIASAHEGVTFSCTFCDRVFSMKTELNRHNKNVHTNKQQKPPTRTIMHF